MSQIICDSLFVTPPDILLANGKNSIANVTVLVAISSHELRQVPLLMCCFSLCFKSGNSDTLPPLANLVPVLTGLCLGSAGFYKQQVNNSFLSMTLSHIIYRPI